MATQIFAKPDRDGIIRVACGNDVIEVIVLPRGGFWGWGGGGGPGGGGGGGSGPRPSGGGGPGSGQTGGSSEREAAPEREGNPLSEIDTPYILYVHPDVSGKVEMDNERVLHRLHAELASNRPNPTRLVLGLGGAADIHAIADLSSQVRKSAPEIDIALDFGFEIKSG